MYLYTRSVQLAPGRFEAGMSWAVDVGQAAGDASGLPVTVWTNVLSPGLGTIGWSAMVPSMATMIAALDATPSSARYRELVAQGRENCLPGINETMTLLLHGGPLPGGPPSIASITVASVAPGKYSAALGDAMAATALAEEITGSPVMLGQQLTGASYSFVWIGGESDPAALDASTAKMMGDSRWLAMLDTLGANCNPGVTTTIVRRLS